MAAAKKKAAPERQVEIRTVEYLPAGFAPNPLEGNEPSIDPELEKIRDAEAKANDVEVFRSFEEPTIDDELVKARQAELERDAKRAGVKLSDTSVGKSESKATAKKASASKSEK